LVLAGCVMLQLGAVCAHTAPTLTAKQVLFILVSWFSASNFNTYKYNQRDATVSWLLFQELYMFRAFTMSIIRSNITA
jgi:hypothetical protein